MKNKKLIFILSVCIIIFTSALIHKTFENDTYFTIATGNYILENGVNEVEPFTWHENLKFTKLRWGFDIAVASIYNLAGYNGLYIFTVIMSATIGVCLFITLIKRKNNVIVSFIMTLFVMMNLKSSLVCRGQIMSYLFFILEIYSIQMLLETRKKKYSIYLIIISVMILTFHSSVWLAHFVFYLPYIVEAFLNKIKINTVVEETGKLELEQREKGTMKMLFITMLIVFITGFCTPLGLTPFTYMFKVIGGYSSKIINELQPLKITRNIQLFVTVVGILGVLSITKTKIKLTDVMLAVGVLIMAKMAYRNMPIAVLILAYPSTMLITKYIKTYNKERVFDRLDEKLNKNIPILIIILLIIAMISITNYRKIYKENYVEPTHYPIGAAEFIKENLDLDKIKLYNHFNFGSYLELQGIPTFIDSRSEVYCKEFNNVTILEDFANFDIYGTLTPEDMIEKYGFTHFVFSAGNRNALEMKNNNSFNAIYDDGKFVVFEYINEKVQE